MIRQLIIFLSTTEIFISGFIATTHSTYSKTTALSKQTSLYADQNNNNPAGDLTNTLARLDKQWKIQQSSKPGSRWTKLVLPQSSSTSSTTTDFEEAPPEQTIQRDDFVYLLEPPYKSTPSCMIVFTGGAGLGTYPQIAYNEFLLSLSNRLNAAIVTAPYNVGLDHFTISKQTGELTRRAIIYCQDDPTRQYPESLPVYSLSHSLGSKLSCIYAAATNQNYNGIGYISFNNFSFSKTIGMAKQFAETIRNNSGMGSVGTNIPDATLDSIFGFAEMAVSAVGIDFQPTQEQMETLINKKYDTNLASKTRLFTFDNDTLQSTKEFIDACSVQPLPDVSELPGTHLTPVYFELGWDEMDLPDETKQIAMEMSGGFQKASFGNKDELDTLVNEVCNWILGKPPTQKPSWLRDRPQISSTSSSSGASSTP